MKTVSLRTENVPTAELAKALATKALELLTSWRLSMVLGVVAFLAIMLYHATAEHPVLMACLTLTWAAQLAACLTLDITKGGEEL